MSNPLEALCTAIADESLTLAERRTAAGHLVTAQLESVTAPQDDDAEIAALITPPKYDGVLADIMPRAWAIANEQRGWASSGPTLLQARRYVQEQRRTDLLKEIYRNRELHRLEREEAAQRLLDNLPTSSMQRRNGYTAARLIAEAS